MKQSAGFRMIGASIALLLTGAGCSADAPTSDDITAKFNEVVAASLECKVDTDCTLVFPGCPLGRYVVVSREKAITVDETARSLLRQYAQKDQACTYEDDGEIPPVAVCGGGTCKEPTVGSHAPPPPPDAGSD
jgi:hypothetical protein